MSTEMFEDLDTDDDAGSDDDDSPPQLVDRTDAPDITTEDDDDEDDDDDKVTIVKDKDDDKDSKTKKKKSKRSKNRKEKDKSKMTNKEIEELEEKQHSYSTNIYKVQMDELLADVYVSEKAQYVVREWVTEFSESILTKNPSKPYDMSEMDKLLKPIQLPLLEKFRPGEGSKGTFQWFPPASVELVGSFATGSAVRKISYADVAVEMPKECLNHKDYLNHRYHIKRAVYAGYLAKLLSKNPEKVQFGRFNGNPLLPTVEVELSINVRIRLLVVPPAGFFKLSRFNMHINNLKYHHFFGVPQPEDEPEYNTPNYNFTLLTDAVVRESSIFVQSILSKSLKYQEALKLLKIWLHQRSLSQGYGGFSGFILSAFMAYLSAIGKLSSVTSTYEIVRIVLVNLMKTDLTKNGISFCEGVQVADWHLQFDVVFVDSTGFLNLASDMSKFTYRRIQFEAERALKTLNGAKIAGFKALFLTKVRFIQDFDHVFFTPDVLQLASKLQEEKTNEQHFLNHSGFIFPIGTSLVGQLIEKCLQQRVQLIDVELNPSPEWEIKAPAPEFTKRLAFGLIINSEASKKLIERCDTSDISETTIFKELWGDRSEMRRFKDGTMCETVVFKEKSRLCYQMLSYVIQKHLQLSISPEDYLDSQIPDLMERGYQVVHIGPGPKKPIYIKGKKRPPQKKDLQELVPVTHNEVSSQALAAFDELSKLLRSLTGLPLEITTVQGTAPTLRFSNVFPTPPQRFYSSKLLTETDSETEAKKPKTSCVLFKKIQTDDDLPPKVPKLVEPIGVILHLETSGKWPDDLKAIYRLKCAFLIRIGQLLKEQFNLTIQPYPEHLDILKDGFVFRIKLTYYRELALLKMQIGSDGLMRLRDNAESLRLEKESLLLPQLTSSLHSFQRQFEAFGQTCRLAKRWMAAQLLLASPLKYQSISAVDPRFTEESVELLVAHIFLYFAPHLSAPNESQLGFLRFLTLLAEANWEATPLVLNFSDKLTPEEISSVELDFVKRRKTLPSLFIATPEDTKSSVWTKNLDTAILVRSKILSRGALEQLKKPLEALGEGEMKDLPPGHRLAREVLVSFTASTKAFNFKIVIKKEMNARHGQRIVASDQSIKLNAYVKGADETIPILDFDPVQLYLQDLREAFGHVAMFLHDNYGGQYIAGIWRPETREEQPFSISHVNASFLNAEGKLCVNLDGILEMMQLLGKGLVDRIEMIEN